MFIEFEMSMYVRATVIDKSANSDIYPIDLIDLNKLKGNNIESTIKSEIFFENSV